MSNNQDDDSFMNDSFSVNAVATASSNSQKTQGCNLNNNTFKKNTTHNPKNNSPLKNEQTTGSKKRSIGKFCKNCGTILLDEKIEGKEGISTEAADCVCVENSEGIINRSRSQWGQIMLYRGLKHESRESDTEIVSVECLGIV